MSSLTPLKIPALLRKYGIHPDKSLGQNFLVDESALRRVVDAAQVSPDEAVLEIGAGLGSLTRHLANAARHVIAVEVDDSLIPPLREVLSEFENVKIIHGDILDIDPADILENENSQFPIPNFAVVANIPYYITSAIIRHLLEAETKPRRIVLTVQHEVATRICATPGNLSLLALSVQVYGNPRIVAKIPAGAFYPAPKVDSAVVRIDLFPEPLIHQTMIATFFELAKSGFGQKRKTLRNSISSGMGWSKERTTQVLESAAIDPQRRAETLTLQEWNKFVKHSLNL